MTVSEYEAKFAALSRFAIQLIPTNLDRCQRFRYGLHPSVATRLTAFRERDYADLVDMATLVGRDVENLNEHRAKKNNSGGGGSYRAGVNKPSFKKSHSGSKSQGSWVKREDHQGKGSQSVGSTPSGWATLFWVWQIGPPC